MEGLRVELLIERTDDRRQDGGQSRTVTGGEAAFQPHLTVRHGTGRLWAFIGGGVAALAVVLVAVLAVTGGFTSGPPHYTQAQAQAAPGRQRPAAAPA